jgi:hypothetical protein
VNRFQFASAAGPRRALIGGSGRCSRSPEFVPLNVIRIPVGLEKCSQSSGIDVHGSRNRCSRWPGMSVHDRPEYAKSRFSSWFVLGKHGHRKLI